jgi:hypothetical protein
MNTLAQSIPPRIRQVIYSVLATIVALEAIFDVVPDEWQGKILSALTVLGFGVAFGNVSTPPTPLPPPSGGVPEQFPGEFQ